MASVTKYDSFALIMRNHGPLTRAVRWVFQINDTLLKLQFEPSMGLQEAQAVKLQEILERQFGATVLRPLSIWPDQRYTEQVLIGLRDDQLTTANLNEIAQIVQDCHQGDA